MTEIIQWFNKCTASDFYKCYQHNINYDFQPPVYSQSHDVLYELLSKIKNLKTPVRLCLLHTLPWCMICNVPFCYCFEHNEDDLLYSQCLLTLDFQSLIEKERKREKEKERKGEREKEREIEREREIKRVRDREREREKARES